MPKILIVDDEPRYREYLDRALCRRGCEVRTAAGPGEALGVGLTFQPDILITDWMLKDELDGLHTVRALRAIYPDLETIVITGFCSADLLNEAREQGVYTILEKPFEIEELYSLVAALSAGQDEKKPAARIAVVEADEQGKLLFANANAQELLAGRVAVTAATIFDIFTPETLAVLDEPRAAWVDAPLKSGSHELWSICSRKYDDQNSRLLMFHRSSEMLPENDLLACMFFGLTCSNEPAWPLDARVLVVADEELVRSQIVGVLRQSGCFCHVASTLEKGFELFGRDAGIRVVILNYAVPAVEQTGLVAAFKKLRSDTAVVDPYGRAICDNFRLINAEMLQRQPWTPAALINSLYRAESQTGQISAAGLSPSPAVDADAVAAVKGAVGVVTLSREGRILDSNSEFCELVGYSAAELREMFITDLTGLKDVEADYQLLRELLSGCRSSYGLNKQCFHRSGQALNTRWTALAVPGVAGAAAVFVGTLEVLDNERPDSDQKD